MYLHGGYACSESSQARREFAEAAALLFKLPKFMSMIILSKTIVYQGWGAGKNARLALDRYKTWGFSVFGVNYGYGGGTTAKSDGK